MSDNQLDNLFEKGLRNSEFPYREGAWEDAEKLIIESQKGRGGLGRSALILALILIVGGTLGGLYVFGPDGGSETSMTQSKSQTVQAASLSSSSSEAMDIPVPEPAAVSQSPDQVQTGNPSATPESPSPDRVANSVIFPSVLIGPEEGLYDDGASLETAITFENDLEKVDPRLAGPYDEDFETGSREKRMVPSQPRTGLRLDMLGGMIPSIQNGVESSGQELFPFYAGLNLVVIPSMRWEIGVGAQYEQMAINGQANEISQSEFSFGSTQTVYTIDPSGVGFVSVPLYIAYKPGVKHRIKIGAQYSRLVRVQSNETVSTYQNGQISGATNSSTQEGYFSGFNENSLSAVVGYEYKIRSRLGLDIQARIGLTPVQDNSSSTEQMFHLKVGLTYNLWGK